MHEARVLKRWVQAGVYAAIAGFEPFYLFVLHYSLPQMLVGFAIGLIIATTAIEGAFSQIYKLRKRSAYPGLLLQELGLVSGAAAAAEHAQTVIARLMRLKGAFTVLGGPGVDTKALAVSGITKEQAGSLLAPAAQQVAAAMQHLTPQRLGDEICSQAGFPGHHIVFVPVVALDQTTGVLALVSERRNRDLKDAHLLTAIGSALGLTLENLRQKAELREGEERLRTVITGAPVILSAVDSSGILTFVEGRGLEAIGVDAAQAIGISIDDLYAARPQTLAAFKRALTGEEVTFTSEFAGIDFESRLSPMRSNDGAIQGVISVSWDVSEQKRAESALIESEERYRLLYETSRDVVYTVDATGTITSLNPAFETITGWSREDWIGKNFAPIVHPEDLPAVVDRFQTLLRGEDLGSDSNEWRVRSKSGEYFVGEFVPVPQTRDGNIVGAIGFVRDITERRKAEDTIRRLAYHDVLTGLPNRALFEDRLNVALAQAKRNHQMVGVLFFDLDRFKLVNDTVGHAGGDRLLQQVATELSELVREGDTVARIGGDEFVFLLAGLGRAEDAALVAERILERLRGPRLLGDQEFSVSTSVGIALHPRDGKDAESLMRKADTAMYRAKERGRDNYQFYNAIMEATLRERIGLESDLRHALERGEFMVYYQPVLNTSSERLVGCEALVRWQHPTRGLVSPDEFVPLAEETGYIAEIGEWVLRAACAQSRAWRDAGNEPIRMTVNVSARQLERVGLVNLVDTALRESALPADSLHLEITEGAMMKNVDAIIAMLTELRDMGVGISVDDFGTGYSSLNYLKRFPIDTIKIDRSFVRDVVTDANDAAIVTTVTTLAHNMGLKVIAEGVETDQQLAFLRTTGCDEFQGYLISEPLSAQAFGEMLARDSRSTARIIPIRIA